MKKTRIVALLLAAMLILTACGGKTGEWKEQYDLGLKYLSAGNYEEAILAFTAAISIDPKRAGAYISLAEAYTAAGDADEAAGVFLQAMETLGETEELLAAMEKLLAVPPAASSGPRTERVDLQDGYLLIDYDAAGKEIRQTGYTEDGVMDGYRTYEYHANGNMARATFFEMNGAKSVVDFDTAGRKRRETNYRPDGSLWTIMEYDENGNAD